MWECGNHDIMVILIWYVLLQGGVLFKGNLRGLAARSYEKIAKRMEVGDSASSLFVD